MTPVVELQSVSISFDSKPIFANLSLSFFKQQVHVLIGPSGQGKSVLLKMIGGILPPLSGKILIHQQDLFRSAPGVRKNLLLEMGMLFKKNALFDSMTVLENVEFPLRETTKQSPSEIREWALHLLREVGLDHVISNYPSEISGGMQKRLGVARALALKPKIILYDDPTAGLDPITSRKIVDLILKLQIEHKSTVIAVTNDMNRAFQMADQILMVVEGEVIQAGSAEMTKTHADARLQQFIRGAVTGPLTEQRS